MSGARGAVPAIRVAGLRTSFGTNEVLAGVDLEVAPGTILGYLGPNGAGKTTTVRILTALRSEWTGEVLVDGFDPSEQPLEVKARIGYVPENAALYGSLTLAEFLLFVGRLHGLPDETIRARAEVFLDVFELEARLGTRILTLSKGMRQKVLLTSALLHAPRILFLDEPLSGLDVASTVLVKTLLRQLADSGRTIFYCSHVMDVVERLCDRIAILHRGRIVAEGTPTELAESGRGETLESVFAELTRSSDSRAGVERIVEALDSN